MKNVGWLGLMGLLLAGCFATAADSSSAEGWISLFNGADLTGWKASEGVEWNVVDGEIGLS